MTEHTLRKLQPIEKLIFPIPTTIHHHPDRYHQRDAQATFSGFSSNSVNTPTYFSGYNYYNTIHSVTTSSAQHIPCIQLPQVREKMRDCGAIIDVSVKGLKIKKRNLSKYKVAVLRLVFEKTQFVNLDIRSKLATILGITDTQVKTWFRNSRVKHRKTITASLDSVTPSIQETRNQMYATGRARVHSYPSPAGLAGYPLYQCHPFNPETVYPGQHTPYIQPPQVKEENHDDVPRVDIKGSNKSRKYMSKDQIAVLCSVFEKTQYLDMKARTELAASIGVTAAQIKTWIQNKRVKHRKNIAASSNSLQSDTVKSEPMTPTASLKSFDFL